MLQRYKLRLGDGTVLTVDPDGLRTWQTDGKASVQVAGTQVWRPLREYLAEEESAARLARALVPPEPRRAPVTSPPELSPSDLPPPELPPLELSPPELPPPSRPAELPVGAPPMVQALAEDTAVAGTPAAPWRDRQEAAARAPAIRLKPLDDEPPAPYVFPSARTDDDDDFEEEDQAQRHDRLEGPLLQVISTFGNLLSRCLDPLTALLRGWPSTSADELAPRRAAHASPNPARRPSPTVTAPPRARVLAENPLPPKPPDDEERPEATIRQGFSGRLSGWVAGLAGWVGRLAGGHRPEPLVLSHEPAPKRQPAPAARQPLAPPVPISELPVLRFAEVHEPVEVEDVYEGERAESPFPVLWLWTKRIVLVGGLGTAGVLAALYWQTWFPRAAELGQRVFTEIDRQARSSQRTEEQQRALREATERLPQLAPGTIRLVLSASDRGVPDPPEVFQLASEAADRGLSALTPPEADELRALQRELLGHLRPPERARVAEYDRARSRRVVFPFENPHALELVARGARAMPSQSRERLQTLLGKAVAAGLRLPATSPASAPSEEPAPR
jgi:hypothetical protein